MEQKYCPFCDKANYEREGDLAFTKTDSYPVSKGHTLVIPKRHISSYFECTDDERLELWSLVEQVKTLLDSVFEPDGFNIGINIGAAAGQTVPHMHIHVIPRYSGDMDDPRGGVRGVIPDKQKY
ncbi:HIT family protein [Porticoccaceae bacterium]|nr:HIT family protein [Porticoccaceae bacterium]